MGYYPCCGKETDGELQDEQRICDPNRKVQGANQENEEECFRSKKP
jgi:hypothetical protein